MMPTKKPRRRARRTSRSNAARFDRVPLDDAEYTLILTFSQRWKELRLLFSPVGRDGREAPVRERSRLTGRETSSFPNSVWERTCLRNSVSFADGQQSC